MRLMTRRAAVAAVAGIATTGTVATAGVASAVPVPVRADVEAIRSVVDGIDDAVDAKDWRRCRAYFTEVVHIDFESLEGGPAGRITADDLIAGWETVLYADKASFHSRTNHELKVNDSTAHVRSKGYAFNRLPRRLGDDLWELWAIYSHELVRTSVGWRCSAIGIPKVLHARGNELVRTHVP